MTGSTPGRSLSRSNSYRPRPYTSSSNSARMGWVWQIGTTSNLRGQERSFGGRYATRHLGVPGVVGWNIWDNRCSFRIRPRLSDERLRRRRGRLCQRHGRGMTARSSLGAAALPSSRWHVMAFATLDRTTPTDRLSAITLEVSAAALRARKRRWAWIAVRVTWHTGKVLPGYTTGP